jgi:vancomycin aglycone glucosyltransferase
MRFLLSTWGSRGDVEPLMGLAVQLLALGADVRVCAPPDFEELLSRIDVEFVPTGQSVRALVHGSGDRKPSTPADAPRVAAAIVDSQFDTIAPAAEGCDAIVATGMMPAGMRTIAEMLDIPYVLVAMLPGTLPSKHNTPLPRPGKPFPPGETDNRVLWDIDAERVQVLYGPPLNARRAALGLPPVHNVRDHVHTERPWLATDPTLGPCPPDVDVVQTGAWILPDDRPLPPDLLAFLDAGTPPVYAGFSSVRAPEDAARVAIEAIRSQGRRVVVSRGWADLALIDDLDDCFVVGEVNLQALFARVAAVVHHGGAGTTTTAARAGAAQVVVPQIADQPYWAGRVANLGIGVAHDGSTPTVGSLSAALRVALAPEIRGRATAVAGTIRTDGAAEAARRLVASVRERRDSRGVSPADAHSRARG